MTIGLIMMIAASYLLGSINPAYLLGRAKGFDIRRRGSNNAGASNALIVMGKRAGVLIAFLDIFKAFLAVTAAQHWLPSLPYAGVFAGVACTVGHIFPLFMHFRGGKGLACLGGLILALDARLFVAFLALELILVLLADYICIVPISAAALLPIVYWILAGDRAGAVALLAMAIVIVCKHMENIKRIRQGTEAHFSFLWKRKDELERLAQKNAESADREQK